MQRADGTILVRCASAVCPSQAPWPCAGLSRRWCAAFTRASTHIRTGQTCPRSRLPERFPELAAQVHAARPIVHTPPASEQPMHTACSSCPVLHGRLSGCSCPLCATALR